MPSAGAVVPPNILPLRHPQPGQPASQIDTATFIKLETETPRCKIFFTTDGSKPNPYQRSFAGRETTFKYRGPFTLKEGTRTLKAIAVTRDKVKESNVMTKTFQVVEVGPPDTDVSDHTLNAIIDDLRPASVVNTRSSWSSKKRRPNNTTQSYNFSNNEDDDYDDYDLDNNDYETSSNDNIHHTGRPAWQGMSIESSSNSSAGDKAVVHIPEGPFNPTNYSGTQFNFWGVSPNGIPQIPVIPGEGAPNLYGGLGTSTPYGSAAQQLGYMTNRMLQNLEQQPRLTVADLRRLIENEMKRYAPSEPEVRVKSPGGGDWKSQVNHVAAHLGELCRTDTQFRNKFGEPQLGQIIHASFDEEDDAYLLTLSLRKANMPAKPAIKAPPKPKPAPVKKPKEAPKKSAPSPPPPKPKKPPTPTPPRTPEPPPKPASPPPPPRPETPKIDVPKTQSYFVTEEYKQDGTVKPWPTFNAEADCQTLKKAMRGLGTDEKAIVNVMGFRTCDQRLKIVGMYKTMFGKDLRQELESETSGAFCKTLKGLCLPPDEYDAHEIEKAVKGLGTDESTLVEILCTRTNAQIKMMKDAYKRIYNKELEKAVSGDTSGDFKNILVSQIQANRDENPKYDQTAAQADAQQLFSAGEGKWGTDESVFNKIMCQRSFPHLRAVFEEYSKVANHDIEKAIEKEFSYNAKKSLLTIVKCIRDKPRYFASLLGKAMKGLGTNDDDLVRVVVSRCEVDMVQIKESFEKDYKKNLAEWLKGDTSGDYKNLLLALVGELPAPAPSAAELEEQGPPEIEEMEEEKIQYEGTVKPASPFDAKSNCEALKKAIKGLGTDEKAVINALTKCSTAQRVEIVQMYKTMFGKDLQKELQSELSSNFLHVMSGLCMSAAEFDATELRKAMKGVGTDEECLFEILCSRTNEELDAIKKAYTQIHNRNLEKDLVSETSGSFKNLMVALCQANRPGGNTIDRRKARSDAKALFEAGEKKWGTDNSVFNAVLCSRSYAHLRAMFQEYEKLSKKDIEQVIKDENSGDLCKGYLSIVRCIRNKPAYFAKRLYDAMHGLGTNDDSLIRTVISRCEIDMVQIKQEFEKNYKQPLAKFIADDISGDYLKSILMLIGEESSIKK